jgi:hypothetical protein
MNCTKPGTLLGFRSMLAILGPMGTSQPDPLPDVTSPLMSVILVTDTYSTISRVICRLGEQTVRAHLEIVFVVPSGQMMELDRWELKPFANVRLVQVTSILPLAAARAAGVRAASAPIVAIGETHAFPHPGWAEALIKAHEQPWAVVVPAFCNANPEGPLSGAAFLRDYGLWMDGLPAGEIEFVPPYNTATKRSVLLASGGAMERLVSRAEELASTLRAGGYRCYFEPAAKIDHANVARVSPYFAQRFLSGQVLAAGRIDQWSRARILLYICAAPLIPAVILTKLRTPIRLMRANGRLSGRTLFALVLGAVTSAAGETVTYAFGARPSAKRRLDEYELYKLRYTSIPPR